MPHRILPLLVLLASGCGAEAPVEIGPPPPPELGTRFDATRAGRVEGRVTWKGAIPDPPGFLLAVPQADGLRLTYLTADNPHRPNVEPKSRAVEGAVVFLHGVDPAAARPWDLPPVRVEMGPGRIDVLQGEGRRRVGFVRRGQEFTAASAEPRYHVLRGRGDAFFSLPLPEPHRPVRRTLTAPGRIELSSGTGLYWARAHLFVADHPYFTLTDHAGRFTLDQVPAGPVEVVVWLPGWEVAGRERDPDSTAIARMHYTPPIERRQRNAVPPRGTVTVDFTVP